MCGIVGYFTLHGASDPALPRLVAMARDLLTYRGPDDAGLYTSPDGRCVLGCRRLAIQDRSSAGRQPMPNEDGSVWAVCNGEIYNAQDLRRVLVRKGHRFRSRCDVEVIVHLYEEYGPDLVHHLDGMFSLVLYDVLARRLVGARDPLGVKPLYYALSARRFAFASEPKALLALPDVSRQPRLEELSSYLAFNCTPGPATLHRDIDKLEPGTRFDVSSTGAFSRERFWTPPPSGVGRLPGDPAAAVDASLRQAVRKRMIADVRVGAALSGGVDSSLVVALMSETAGPGVPTFTIGYPGDEERPTSDLRVARIVAQRFRTEHHELVIDVNTCPAIFDELADLADDPIGAPSQAALLHLASQARRAGVITLQVGEGADEVFCGYPGVNRLRRLHAFLSRGRRWLPPWLAGAVTRAAGHRLERIAVSPSPLGSSDGTLFEVLRRYARRELVYWGHGVLFCPPEQERLFRGRPPVGDAYERLRARVLALDGFQARPYGDRLALIDMLLELPERLLMRLDRATMRHGVEAREPFLDPAVLAAAFRVPAAVRGAGQKGFLRAYARRTLPADVLGRAKVGFPIAPGVFLARSARARIRERLLARPFLDFTGLAGDRVQDLLVACEADGTGMAQVWSLYVLALWFHRWV